MVEILKKWVSKSTFYKKNNNTYFNFFLFNILKHFSFYCADIKWYIKKISWGGLQPPAPPPWARPWILVTDQ